MRFKTGRHLLTRGAAQILSPIQASGLIRRHAEGDWGDLEREDCDANEWAIGNEARILSAYVVLGHRFYVITEADRESTTVLLCEEY